MIILDLGFINDRIFNDFIDYTGEPYHFRKLRTLYHRHLFFHTLPLIILFPFLHLFSHSQCYKIFPHKKQHPPPSVLHKTISSHLFLIKATQLFLDNKWNQFTHAYILNYLIQSQQNLQKRQLRGTSNSMSENDQHSLQNKPAIKSHEQALKNNHIPQQQIKSNDVGNLVELQKRKKTRKYRQNPKKNLWWAFMQVIVEQRFLFVSWGQQLKIDLFKLVAKKLPNLTRNDIKSWNQTQKENYFLEKHIDMMEAILIENEQRIQNQPRMDPLDRQKFQEFVKILEERKSFLDILSKRCVESRVRSREMKMIMGNLFEKKEDKREEGRQEGAKR